MQIDQSIVYVLNGALRNCGSIKAIESASLTIAIFLPDTTEVIGGNAFKDAGDSLAIGVGVLGTFLGLYIAQNLQVDPRPRSFP
jgi:hypothetical protein